VIQREPSTKAIKTASKSGFFEHYGLGKKLGAGAFAQVRVALCLSDDDSQGGFSYAVKVVDLRRKKKDKDNKEIRLDQLNPNLRTDTRLEAAVWLRVTEAKNPYCVKLHDVFWDNTFVFFVMERCDMTLLRELEHTSELNELKLGKLFQQMALAISGLHFIQVVHRDVKPDNFLVNGGGRVKLGDYGLSTVVQGSKPMTEVYGTAPFMSPEMLRDASYGPNTDLWSLGVLMYVLVYGAFPYEGPDKSSRSMKQAIKEGTTLPDFQVWKHGDANAKPTESLMRLIKLLLARDARERPTAPEVLANQFWFQLTQPAVYAKAPSMRSALSGAKRAGAFTIPNRKKENETKDDTDILLSELSRRSAVHPPIAAKASIGSLPSIGTRASSQASMPHFKAHMGRTASDASSMGNSGCADSTPRSQISATSPRQHFSVTGAMSPTPSISRSRDPNTSRSMSPTPSVTKSSKSNSMSRTPSQGSAVRQQAHSGKGPAVPPAGLRNTGSDLSKAASLASSQTPSRSQNMSSDWAEV